MNNFLIVVFFSALILVLGGSVSDAFAVTVESNGSGGGDWNDGSTWAGGVVPSSTDDVTIKNGDVVTIKDSRTIDSTGSLIIEGGAELKIDGLTSGVLTNFGDITNNGLLTINGGTGLPLGELTNRVGGSLTNNATIEINGGTGFGSGKLVTNGVFTNNDLVTVNGASSPGSGNIQVANSQGSFTNFGTMNFNGGTGDSSGGFQIQRFSNITNECTGTITMNGNTTLRSGRMVLFGSLTNSGTIFLNGNQGVASGQIGLLVNGILTNHNTIIENPGAGEISGIIDIGGGTLIEDPIPCPGLQVGGKIISVDTTSLILAGTQMTVSWLIPVIVAGLGFAIVIARKV